MFGRVQEDKLSIDAAETEVSQEQAQENIEDIMNSIKDVISGDKSPDGVLELTDIVHEGGNSNFKDISSFDDEEVEPAPQVKQSSSEEVEITFGHSSDDGTAADELSLEEILTDPVANSATSKPEIKAEVQQPVKPTLLDEKVLSETKEALSSMLKSVEKHHDSPKFRGGTTIEDLVIELLKPELKAWLNEHLPSIVKTVVEKEVRKIIPQD